MKRTKVYTTAWIVTITVFMLFVIPKTYAQDVQNGTNGSTQIQQGSTTGGLSNDGFNYWWLLPLLAIPILYLTLRREDKPENVREYRARQQVVGAKGGQKEVKDQI